MSNSFQGGSWNLSFLPIEIYTVIGIVGCPATTFGSFLYPKKGRFAIINNMKAIKIMILLLFLVMIILPSAWCVDRVGRPMLLSPNSEEVVLTGQDTLKFRWLADLKHYNNRDYYDFRIYKGYQMTADTLIFKQKLPAHTGHFTVDTGMFENGQIYTWSVRHIVGVEKSDQGHYSFKAVK